MAKRKRKKDRSGQKAVALRQNGLKAFAERDYARAINAWQRAYELKREPPLAAALAEAYFRRGLKRQNGRDSHNQDPVADLKQAVTLQPGDSCYTYHLALALHRLDRASEALPLYRQVRRSSDSYARRAAYPLALALLQQGEDPARHPVWPELSRSEQVMLHLSAAPEAI
jgi:tetratricopeptide (TPR) repeat protein